MPEVDYKALCISLSRQNGDLALTVDSYQREIIPKYESLLKKARAERDDLADELSKALSVLRWCTGCNSCKHQRKHRLKENEASQDCLSNRSEIEPSPDPSTILRAAITTLSEHCKHCEYCNEHDCEVYDWCTRAIPENAYPPSEWIKFL